MKIKKIGHCCLIIEIDGLRIITDPGMFSTEQNSATGVDVVLITHEHGDHLHTDSVKAILAKNPGATVITNSAVGKHLAEAGVKYTVIEGRAKTELKGVAIEAFDCKHEEIYGDMGLVQNTAYLMGNKLFFPGDAFFAPERPVEVLALPVAGPWCKTPDAIRYGLRVKPQKAFPVHDAVITKAARAFYHGIPAQILKENGIGFTPMDEGDEAEF